MSRRFVLTSICVLGMGAVLQAQAAEELALYAGTSVNWNAADCAAAHLRISSNDAVIERSFESCTDITFAILDDVGQPLPDGLYHYELNMLPKTMVDDQVALKSALSQSDEKAFEALLGRLRDYSIRRHVGMFRVNGGVASEFNESIAEAEAETEAETN